VKLSRRPSDQDTAGQNVAVAEPTPEVEGGKGRPTPKRRDIVGIRGPVTAPKTRKEAYARQKAQAKTVKTASRKPQAAMTAGERRALLKAGDPAVLPRRDQGSTRKLARDYVDSHRMASNYFLWLFPLLIAGGAVKELRILQLITLSLAFGFIGEWYVAGRRIRRMAMERFGEAQGGNMSIGFYAGSRAYLLRRWRLPAAQVKRGDEI
jgi:hypothetical protein